MALSPVRSGGACGQRRTIALCAMKPFTVGFTHGTGSLPVKRAHTGWAGRPPATTVRVRKKSARRP